MALVECVANISEGRNPRAIMAVANAIRSVKGVKLLFTDTGYGANRTVFTFIGSPEGILESALAMYRAAIENIDMAEHQGAHPRLGAVDVCPLIPLQDISTAEVAALAVELAQQLADELDIGGYYYSYNATRTERELLSYLRQGQYESLPGKIEKLPLDFGSGNQWRRFGLTVIGCRPLLVAYNVNLNTRDPEIAHKVAQRVRESGYLLKRGDGTLSRVRGLLKKVRGLGWYIKDFDVAQASYNLTDLSINGMLECFETTKKVAAELGCQVTGSELIGLAPLSEFEKVAARLSPENTWNRDKVLAEAVAYLGLNEVRDFDPQQQVLDLQVNTRINTRL